MLLKTITFNMCHGMGEDGVVDVTRQVNFLKQYNPDVVFLQEIDMFTDRVQNKNQISEFSKQIELPYSSMGINIKYKSGFYGDGILSKFPIEYSTNYLLPLINPNNEQRGILCNRINFGTTKINLYSVHLSTYEPERKLATMEILKIISKISSEEIIILGGDFNVGKIKIGDHKYKFIKKDVYEEYEILQKKLKKTPNDENTWCLDGESACIDTIFYSPNISLKKFDTLKTNFSDHNALYVEFEI